jgi:hypothetical protein
VNGKALGRPRAAQVWSFLVRPVGTPNSSCYDATMSLRVLYLQRRLSVNGRSAVSGRRLFDALKGVSDDTLLAHMVVEQISKDADPRMRDDLVSREGFFRLNPNVIFMEGGFFANDQGTWRVPRSIAEEFVSLGGAMIVADADVNELNFRKEIYRAASDFLGASADYLGENDVADVRDDQSFWKSSNQIVCRPEEVVCADWLRPVYRDVREIVVGNPARLVGWEHILCTGNRNSTIGRSRELPGYEPDSGVFATICRRSLGWVALIAAHASGDVWLERCPDNNRWLVNLATLLAKESDNDRARSIHHLKSRQMVFLSHRSVDKVVVADVSRVLQHKGLDTWLDRERIVPGDSFVEEISRGLEQMTSFVLFWSSACVGAPWVERELSVAVMSLTEKRIPILVVRLDEAPVPTIISDLHRIEAIGWESGEMATAIATAIQRREQRGRAKG